MTSQILIGKQKATFLSVGFLLMFVCLSSSTTAQKRKQQQAEEDTTFTMTLAEDFRPTIELNPTKIKDETEKRKKRNKKRKKNVFYGKKTKRRYIRTKKGRNETIEIFYVLKEYEAPDQFVYTKYYYNRDERSIKTTRQVSPKFGKPLHGTYLRITNGDTIVQGIYYVGTRHGRWVQHFPGETQILRDKKYYYQGFPKTSEVTYWDAAETRPKEVIPLQFGIKDGIYQAFYRSGRLKEVGEYDDGHKVKLWQEYWDKEKNNKKRQVKYPDRAWSEKESYVLREWDEEGHLLKSPKRR